MVPPKLEKLARSCKETHLLPAACHKGTTRLIKVIHGKVVEMMETQKLRTRLREPEYVDPPVQVFAGSLEKLRFNFLGEI